MPEQLRNWKRYLRAGVAWLLWLDLGLAVLVLVLWLYYFEWTGFDQFSGPTSDQNVVPQGYKTLWDWLQLLLVPLALALTAIWFNRRERETERAIADNRAEEAVLETYLDRMSELLLDNELAKSEVGDPVRTVARARTLTALRRLSSQRKEILLLFLFESNLITITDVDIDPVVDMAGIDLSEGNFRGINLIEASLYGVNLREADLSGAYLREAHLGKADLRGADLRGADLSEADLSGADLSGDYRWGNYQRCTILWKTNLAGANLHRAVVTEEQLAKAASIAGMTMPDGSQRGCVL